MSANAVLSAISNGNTLQQFVGIQLFKKMKDSQASQVNTMLQDFAQSQRQAAAVDPATPHLGRHFDARL